MLPMALDALLDVMTTKVEVGRLEQERAAVLSEASMVNKMEYRVECQVLSALHSENRISSRFPIGKENLIKKWQKEKLTCSLMFSNKWVSGFLRRENARRMGSIDNNNDHNNNAIDIHIQSGDQVETMKITASADVNLAADNGNGNITVSHCDDGNITVTHCDNGNITVTYCDDGDMKDDGNVKVSHCDDGDGGNECGEHVYDDNVPFTPYDDDLLRDIIAFINGKGSL
jgi:hypothetical protein